MRIALLGLLLIANNERCGIIKINPHYHAFWIRYSNGLQMMENGEIKNLWCFPKFEMANI